MEKLRPAVPGAARAGVRNICLQQRHLPRVTKMNKIAIYSIPFVSKL